MVKLAESPIRSVGRPSRMWETLRLVADHRQIPLKKLIRLGEEIFGLTERTIRNHLNSPVTLGPVRFMGRELRLSILPVGFYRSRKGERIVYFIDEAPKKLAITYIGVSITFFILGILKILVGDLIGAIQTAEMTMLLAVGPLTLSLIGNRVRRKIGAHTNKVTCLIKYRKKKSIILKATFNRITRLYEIKDHVIKEISKRLGKSIRREYSIILVDRDGREIKINETSRLYALNAETLHFKLKEVRSPVELDPYLSRVKEMIREVESYLRSERGTSWSRAILLLYDAIMLILQKLAMDTKGIKAIQQMEQEEGRHFDNLINLLQEEGKITSEEIKQLKILRNLQYNVTYGNYRPSRGDVSDAFERTVRFIKKRYPKVIKDT